MVFLYGTVVKGLNFVKFNNTTRISLDSLQLFMIYLTICLFAYVISLRPIEIAERESKSDFKWKSCSSIFERTFRHFTLLYEL